jgi:uncharacterized PurR-regulated membrane protein YhhQ (DUF165 family)
MTLNVYIFTRLAKLWSRITLVSGAIASILSQVVDTLIFITVAFYGVRPIGELILGQALAKIVLSVILVPPLIAFFAWLAKEIEHQGKPENA